MKDHKWRSNVLWYDYLQSYKSHYNEIKPTRTSIRHAPSISKNSNSFEAQSLYDFLHEHFVQPKEHFIAYMIGKFNLYFIEEHLEPNENSSRSLQTIIDHPQQATPLNRLVEEIKAFVLLVLQSMIHYYGGVVSKMIEEKPGEMYDLILEEVFTDGLQDCLLHTFFQVNREIEKNYREKIEIYSNLRCSDLGIEPKFQIDEIRDKVSVAGYEKAICKLKELESSYSPLKKLDIIIATTRMICECVDDY